MPILFMRLEGPLQSWGERARWNHRDTASLPTKSAIVGMIAGAMGLKRGDPKITELDKKIRIAIRADRSGLPATDYHTITGQIRTADGGKRGVKGEDSTIISFRQYLQDASFLVAVSGDDKTIASIRDALLNPVWAVYLGRKSCVPSRPVFLEISEQYASLEKAMERYPLDERCDSNVVYEIDDDLGYPRRDIVTGAQGRIYEVRRVSLKPYARG